MDNTETINVLSLCTGYGGLELGLSRALEGVLRVVAVEIEAYALANLAAKTQEGKLAIEAMWPDLKTFPAERFRGCFDFILAGYPCQPFSVAGKRLGEDDPRHLWPHIARIVEAVRPVWCIFENVPGHLSIGFPEVYRSLRDMGYKVEAGLFTAAEVGAPHKRQRLFILGNSQSNGHIAFPKLRSYETTGNERGQEEQTKARQSTGTNRPLDVPSIQRRTNRSELADTEKYNRRPATTRIYATSERKPGTERLEDSRWPARPGQPQYEWEEPRVVADTARADSQGRGRRGVCETSDVGNAEINRVQNRCKRQRGICKKNISKGFSRLPIVSDKNNNKNSTKGQAQSRLGRAINGPACRIDRLRLLGNGIVPQCAEKAIRELIRRFE